MIEEVEEVEEPIFPYEEKCMDCNGKYKKRNPNHLFCRGCEVKRMIEREKNENTEPNVY